MLQVGLVRLALAERARDAESSVVALEAAEAAFMDARASSLLALASSLRGALQRRAGELRQSA
ncbi:hypothetical protein QEG98_32350 [Myxococcus sp. MxC21-1]|nr:hypothetical protein QEG98_32350 [Myxococcus sp. MxC21-1]